MRGADYHDLRVFEAICRLGSLARAAEELRVSASAVSQTLRQLEERLGVRLLNRTTRSIAPTDAGMRLYAQLVPALAGLEAALESVNAHRERPTGTLRLHVPRLAFGMHIEPLLGAFHARCPEVVLDVTIDDAVLDIVEHGFDIGVRLGELLENDMVAVALGKPMRQKTVASPRYLEGKTWPVHPRDLLDHACINWRQRGSSGLYKWEYEKESERVAVAVQGPLVVNDRIAGVNAALQGIGIAMSAETRIDDLVRTGQLVELLEDWTPAFPGFHLYYPKQRAMLAATRAFVDLFAGRPAPDIASRDAD